MKDKKDDNLRVSPTGSNIEYESVKGLRQDVDEEYDSLLVQKKRPKPEKQKTALRARNPYPNAPEPVVSKKKMTTYEDLAKIKGEEYNDLVDPPKMKDVLYADHFKQFKPKRKSQKDVYRPYVPAREVADDDLLIDKIIRAPRIYSRFKFEKKLVFRKDDFPNIEGFDCVIDMQGGTLWESIRKERITNVNIKGYVSSIDKALDLTRRGDYDPDFLEESTVDSLGAWKNIDLRMKRPSRVVRDNKRALEIAVARNKTAEIGSVLGIDLAGMESLIKVPNKKEDITDDRIWKNLAREYGSVDEIPIEEVEELTVEDYRIIDFIGKFRWSFVAILKNINGEDEATTMSRLINMRRQNYLREYHYPGVGTMWTLGPREFEKFGYGLSRVSGNRLPRLGGIPSALGAQFVASYLYGNRVNVLNMKNFPYQGRYEEGKFVDGEFLVSETQIRSSIYRMQNDLVEANGYRKAPYRGYYINQIGVAKREAFVDWRNMARDYGYDEIDSPEFLDGFEFCWSTFPDTTLASKSYHSPDLVVRRERLEDGSPQSIAVEIERKNSTPEEYAETFECYKSDDETYAMVVWITSSSYNANRIKAGAKLAGFKNYKVIPFMNEDGAILVNDYWDLIMKY